MRNALAILVCFFVLATTRAWAAPDSLVVNLPQDHIDITAGFNGANLTVYGVRKEQGEIAIVLKGPGRDMTVRRKENVAGAWLNRAAMNFQDVPVYYNYAISAPENQLAAESILQKNGIGLESLKPAASNNLDQNQWQEFRDALIRNKQRQGLYTTAARRVQELGPGFFRTDFYLPANVHVGAYTIETIYFSGGKVRAVQTTPLKVAHVGMNARVLKFARAQALSYGLLCAFLALFAGWISNRIRSRR